MKQSYTCPDCFEDIEIDETAQTAECPFCFTLFNVSYDAEFIDGIWRNRTKLIKTFDDKLIDPWKL